ncbi:MAG: insulinase family protein [Rhodobacter sp.]|uniref:M16 family metallopeptidase n=1 Tax=Pararhodobacter sp. TaxID=2127056 RepID=UPI001DE0C198|nr:pitrilysin family protein [Pararhodobacter sp.]MCB1345007.1 insulinase family protein [Paracoccaceae bacterium]MCC0071711.1 insulinase family protein [Rhodobacter sp.]HPD92992.1 pitrilysin family protein [Pararhodobacter sp.]
MHRVTTLPNGFRIVTEPMPGLASAAVGIWVTAGARHEQAEQNGIAHFLEHMAFKGTARRTALQIAEEIEDVGGYINAYTSREMTAYYARVLQADVPLALDVIADIVLNPAFEAREIEVERHVILQEIGQAADTPDDVIFDWLQEASYPDQPLGRPILGPADRIARYDAADLRRFVTGHYGPGQMILAASGAVQHDMLVTLAEGLFGHLPALVMPQAAPARFHVNERREVKDLEQAHIALAFEGPAFRDPDLFTAQIYAAAMGGGMSSRLFQKLREERGLCYTTFAQAGAHDDTGAITIYAGTGEEDLAELATLTVDEMKRAAEDLSETEVARARTQMKAGLLMGLESPSSRAERLARLMAIWDRVPDLEETIQKIDAVDLPAIRTYAERLVSEARVSMALYGPVAGAPSLEALRERLVA